MDEDKSHSEKDGSGDEAEAMDNYMDRVGDADESGLKITDIKKLRNDDFVQAVKGYLREPRNKILEVYVRNLKKNMVLGFLVKTDKMLADGTSTRTRFVCMNSVYLINKADSCNRTKGGQFRYSI